MQDLVKGFPLTAATHRCAVVHREHIDVGVQEAQPYQFDRDHRSFFVLWLAL